MSTVVSEVASYEAWLLATGCPPVKLKVTVTPAAFVSVKSLVSTSAASTQVTIIAVAATLYGLYSGA